MRITVLRKVSFNLILNFEVLVVARRLGSKVSELLIYYFLGLVIWEENIASDPTRTHLDLIFIFCQPLLRACLFELMDSFSV